MKFSNKKIKRRFIQIGDNSKSDKKAICICNGWYEVVKVT